MGQHELCGSGVLRLPQLPGRVVAGDGLRPRLHHPAAIGHRQGWRGDPIRCADGHSPHPPDRRIRRVRGHRAPRLATFEEQRGVAKTLRAGTRRHRRMAARERARQCRARLAARRRHRPYRGRRHAPHYDDAAAHARVSVSPAGATLEGRFVDVACFAPGSFVESAFPMSDTATTSAALRAPSRVRQFYALTKPRVVQLIVFCAVIGMLLAVPGLPDFRTALAATAGIWLVAAAAAAFNCLVEQHIDAKMARTAWRPTAKGQLTNTPTLTFSALLCAAGSALLYFLVNPLTMWLTFATFVGYAVIYTVILKPLTPQNIVIGGAAGAIAP